MRVVRQADRGRGALLRSTAIQETDALVTAQPALPIGVLTADCLPVFLLDSERRVAALVHAGWKGVQRGILSKTVRVMEKDFSTQPKDLLAVFGPSIRRCCYEVGKEFSKYFRRGLHPRLGKLYLDLPEVASSQLAACGVEDEHIFDSRLCTGCRNGEFFSYRREGERAGRSMSVIELL